MRGRGLLACLMLIAVVACTPGDDPADDDSGVVAGAEGSSPTESDDPTPDDQTPSPTEDGGPAAATEDDEPDQAPDGPASTTEDGGSASTEDQAPAGTTEDRAPAPTEPRAPAPTEPRDPDPTEDASGSGEVDEELAASFDRTEVALTDGSTRIALAAYVADTPELRRQGLQGWESLPERTGMLFAYDTDSRGGFWMKDTLIPLSIAFADADGRIHTIRDMEPCETEPCPTYEADAPYRYALEVEQGLFDALGVGTGWELRTDR